MVLLAWQQPGELHVVPPIRPSIDRRQRAVDAERVRIARELHDSLTHIISIIKVHAGVAVHLARKRNEPVPEALLAIEKASGEAMRELRANGYGFVAASEADDFVIQFIQNYKPRTPAERAAARAKASGAAGVAGRAGGGGR